MADKIKLLVAVLLVIAGLAGFYFFADAPTVVRVLSVIAGVVLAGVVAGTSGPGKQFFRFALFLWAVDGILLWLVKLAMGQGS
jgi:preprotein translocase subunit SecE